MVQTHGETLMKSLFLLTAGLTTPWPNCNFCGLCWEWWRSVTLRTCWMLRNCVCLVIAHMLDATPVMGWVGWGGDDDIPELAHMLDSTQLRLSCPCTHAGCYATVFVLSLHTCWMLCNCVWELAHWNHCDQTGNQLKRYIPKELRSRNQTTRRDNHRLAEYVWSFLFRMNARPNLFEALGKLAQKTNNARR